MDLEQTVKKVGWKNDVQGREKSYALNYWNALPEDIIEKSKRLKQVQIENRPAIEVIRRFNFKNVLIYADPPYLLNTRHGKQYRYEMKDSDHVELLDALKAHKGFVIVSGYESEMYNDMLKGWHKEQIKSYTQTMTQKIEVIWMNFEPDGQMTVDDLEVVR